jgi:hypothetical protein
MVKVAGTGQQMVKQATRVIRQAYLAVLGYPLDLQDTATKIVLEQEGLLAAQ